MPDTSTEVALATTTLGTAASTITFSSISSAYTDLRVVLTVKMTANAAVYVKLNNNTSVTYAWTQLRGDGTTATASRGTDSAGFALGNVAFQSTQWGYSSFDLFSYAGSSYKTALIDRDDDRSGSGTVLRAVALFPSTTAVSRIDLLNQAGTTFAAGTTATLYGIL